MIALILVISMLTFTFWCIICTGARQEKAFRRERCVKRDWCYFQCEENCKAFKEMTSNHYIYIKGKGFIEASKVKEGDELLTDNKFAKVIKITGDINEHPSNN